LTGKSIISNIKNLLAVGFTKPALDEVAFMIRLIKGFHDILPDETPKWAFIIRTAQAALERFGFREMITPIMEKTELFVRGIGEVTDIVEKEMYTFQDRSGDSLSLRPEATAGMLRGVVEHSLLKKDPVLKVYTIGPMFRRERPSKGRFRQFYQINAEILGDDTPFTDAEAISAAHAIMADIGASGLIMEVNSVGCRECRGAFREKLRSFLSPYLEELCPDCARRYHVNPMRVLDCKVPRCTEIAKDAPLIIDSLDDSCRLHFLKVQDILRELAIPHRVEPRMVRGLDYYTRTAFEIVHEELGRTKAVGGGGRYDTLVKELGGPDASGIGFAIGLERLAMGIPDEDSRFSRAVDLYVAALGNNTRELGARITNELRNNGYSVEMRYREMSLKSQMKVADKLNAKKVIMIGDDELTRQEVTVRDMTTKEQATVPINAIISYVQGEKL
jgi:histidyl-tRNA synthetase